ncbi:MAG: hypothetical protein AABX03_01885 [Nanoarchaeota archaeon]
MKLLKKLPSKYINGNCISYALLWCNGCNQEVERRGTSGLKALSCGCGQYKHMQKRNNPNYKHGENKTKIYKVWISMKQRCYDKNYKGYAYWGGRGITICPKWTDKLNGFINFRDWALNNGYADNLEIDRKNTNGNYEPSNCHFMTSKENQRNRRNNVIKSLEQANEIRELYKTGDYTQKELGEKFEVSQSIISKIICNKTWEF